MKTAQTIAMILLMLFPTIAFGQKFQDDDEPVGIFSSRAEYNQFMGGVKRAAYGEGGNAELRAMVPMLNDIALNKPVGWTASEYNTSGSTLGLLSNEDIRKELEMVDDQYQELQDLSAQIQKRAADQIREIDFSNRDNLVSQIQKIREQATNELNSVLLPHQLDRLRQIRMQALLQRRSLVDVLTSDPVRSDLQITKEQSDELRDFEKQVQQDLARDIAKLQEKARNRLLSKLDPSQQQQAKEMIGEAFEFKHPEKKKTTEKSQRNWGKRKK